jgi:hypothetical protein
VLLRKSSTVSHPSRDGGLNYLILGITGAHDVRDARFPCGRFGTAGRASVKEDVRACLRGGYGGKGGAPPFPQPCWRVPDLSFGAVRQYAVERNGVYAVEWSGVMPVCARPYSRRVLVAELRSGAELQFGLAATGWILRANVV